VKNNSSVREIQERDISLIIDYWLNADKLFLLNMGVDINKMPSKEEWQNMLLAQISQPYENKNSYCIIWQVNGTPVGHSNVNKIVFREEAYMHLHLWKNEFRKTGFGTELVSMTLPYFFENLNLKKLYCEPYALNPAPNKTLKKTGFEFVKEYITTPGFLNFEQKVNLWELSYEKFRILKL
jgi:RimJ/RimL family protein N-acetyltransferase